jgi:hypothetical protein
VPETDRLVLIFKQYVQHFAVSEDLLLDFDVAALPDFLFGQVTFQFRTKILADDLPPVTLTERHRVRYEVPASTWQMWKMRHGRRWYARWLVTRWPVRYEPDPAGRGADAVCTFNLERYRTYPRVRVQLPPGQYGRPYLAHAIRGVCWSAEDVEGDPRA